MTLQDKILNCLKSYPETRDSDITLMIKIWEDYHSDMLARSGGELYVKLDRLYDLPREDNIKRYRAKIQNEEHKYLPTTWEIAKARKINEEIWRRELGYAPKVKESEPVIPEKLKPIFGDPRLTHEMSWKKK